VAEWNFTVRPSEVVSSFEPPSGPPWLLVGDHWFAVAASENPSVPNGFGLFACGDTSTGPSATGWTEVATDDPGSYYHGVVLVAASGTGVYVLMDDGDDGSGPAVQNQGRGWHVAITAGAVTGTSNFTYSCWSPFDDPDHPVGSFGYGNYVIRAASGEGMRPDTHIVMGQEAGATYVHHALLALPSFTPAVSLISYDTDEDLIRHAVAAKGGLIWTEVSE
jgi:hypothetical protein